MGGINFWEENMQEKMRGGNGFRVKRGGMRGEQKL